MGILNERKKDNGEITQQCLFDVSQSEKGGSQAKGTGARMQGSREGR